MSLLAPPALGRGCLLSLRQEMRAPILGPARFVVLVAERSLLAIRDDRDPARLHPLRDEVVHRRLRATLTQGEVVFGGPALVGVALDEHEIARIRLQPRRIG